ncbi:hypothetical protein N7474_008056 [Penicillium riverlandense]|uniref:uncharacterized protein n=1 Tax=Penicillium riverlandense TaxID=1903569 RepID=UPI002546C2FA|nr:uncharacterized protein N7474_008056 [Penicillium riverlandense]KAJ5811755.1 hypothetical protein N7474_008056 [Penicillium riverlandense]
MRLPSLVLTLLAGVAVAADDTTTSSESVFTMDGSVVTVTPTSVPAPSGEYLTFGSTIIVSNDTSIALSADATATTTGNATLVTQTSDGVTVLVGGHGTTTLGNGTANATATASSSPSASPVQNTQPCNDYPEFCNRQYSNITMVAAHNSPFVRPGNAASNQMFDVTSQLDDGVRMLQFQVHLQNGTMYLCHTNCDLLNVGPLSDYLDTVAKWLSQNTYDVVTFLMGNFDYVLPGNITDVIEASPLKDYIYTPPKIPMGLDDWPTLGEMIITGKRAVFFMDYGAKPKEYPWLMDEFSQIWETPFSPTNRNFPCTEQRPPGLSREDAEKRMYIANHNLNLELNFGGLSMLIPNLADMAETNAVSGFGSLGWMAENCTKDWNRPPNFLLVDYYNYGNTNGSVFEVAADMNNVTYNGKCCGMNSAAAHGVSVASVTSMLVVAATVQLVMNVF